MRTPLLLLAGCLLVACGSEATSTGFVPDGSVTEDTSTSVDGASCDGGECRWPCSPDRQTCDDNSANGCESVKATDPAHCSNCLRDCLDTACTKGVCAHSVLAGGIEGVEKVTGFTLDATTLYYGLEMNTGDRRVMSVPLAGGAPTVLASGTVLGRVMAVDAASVYWVDHTHVLRKVARTGGTAEQLATVAPNAEIALDGGYVYWSAVALGSTPGALKRVPVGGRAVESVVTEPTVIEHAGLRGGVAAYDGFIYWGVDGKIKRVPAGGGTPTIIANVPAASIVVDASGVYYYVDGQLQVVPHGGGIPKATTGTGIDRTFLVDSTNVYWQDVAGIQRKPKAAPSTPTVLAVPIGSVQAGTAKGRAITLRTDGKWLYWAAGASVHKIIK